MKAADFKFGNPYNPKLDTHQFPTNLE